MRTTISIISIGIALASFQASVAQAADKANAPKVVKKADLPALKGGKKSAAKYNDGIPQCFSGDRAVFTGSDHDDEPVLGWASNHQHHPCFGADTLYICRAGRHLSVRCEE